MIKNLNDLIMFTTSLAQDYSSKLASQIKLESPGRQEKEINQLLKNLPFIPDNYLSLIKQVNLLGVSIGYFNLWPASFTKESLTDSIILANTDSSNPFLDYYQEKKLIEVASYEADKICLIKRNSPNNKEGKVFLIDITSTPNISETEIADSFLQLLLLAGNLGEVNRLYPDSLQKGIIEFKIRMEKLNVPKNIQEQWLKFFQNNY